MMSWIKNKGFWGSLLSPLIALLIFDWLWGCTHGFEFYRVYLVYAFAAFCAVVFDLPVWIWNARKVQAVVTSLLCLWLEAQLLYGRQFYNAIPPSAYGEAFTVVSGFGSAIIDLLSWKDLLLLIPVALAWISCWGPCKKPGRLQRWLYPVFFLITWCSSWGFIWYAGGIEKTMRNCSYELYPQRVALYSPVSILWHDLVLMFSPISDESQKQIDNWWTKHNKMFGTETYPVETPPRKVILVMVESLESWLVDLEVEGQPVMPVLNKLAHDSTSMYIPNVVCQVLGGHSSDAQLLDMGGMLPLTSGTWALEKHRSLKYSLPLAFTEAHPGASTAYFATDAGRNWNQWGFVPYIGFNTVYFREHHPKDIKPRMSFNRLDDIQLSEFTGHFLNTAEGFGVNDDFLVQQVTISLHSKFELPKGVPQQLTLNESYDDTMRGYLQCARYTDNGLKVLLDSLSKRSDFNDITLIITGDHTGLNYRRKEIREKHAWVTKAPTVPLIVYHSPVHGTFEKYIGQVDLYPTLLDLLGLKGYKWRGMGISIFNPRHPGVGYNLIEGPFGNQNVSKDVIQHLKTAYTVSHNILYYDLMDKVQ